MTPLQTLIEQKRKKITLASMEAGEIKEDERVITVGIVDMIVDMYAIAYSKAMLEDIKNIECVTHQDESCGCTEEIRQAIITRAKKWGVDLTDNK